MKSDYRVRATRFLRAILPYIEDVLMDIYEVEERVKDYNRDHSRKVEVVWGSARIALITSDYVVKFDYDPEEVDSIGGCMNEMELYAQAKAEGFAYLFAEITPFLYSGRMFFIMPRIRGIGSGNRYAEDYMTSA